MAINFLFQNALQGMAVQTTTTSAPFEKIFSLLADFGLFRVILPFLLIFVIFYAIIIKTKVLGEEDKSYVKPSAAIIGLVAGFFVVAYTPVISALYTILPQAGFILVIVVLMLMVLGMVGFNIQDKFTGGATPIAGIIAIIVIVIFLTMIGVAVGPSVPALYWFSQFMIGALALNLPADTMAMLVAAIVLLSIIGGVIYFVVKK